MTNVHAHGHSHDLLLAATPNLFLAYPVLYFEPVISPRIQPLGQEMMCNLKVMLGHKNLLGNKYLKEFRYQKAQSIVNTHTQLSHGKGYLSSSVICTNHPLITSWPRAAIMSLSLAT